MNESYKQKLMSPHWQRRRLEIMQRSKFACEACGETEKQLEIHHREYQQGRDPWEYSDDQLKCVCCDCHTAHHLPLKSLWAAIKEKEGGTASRQKHDARSRDRDCRDLDGIVRDLDLWLALSKDPRRQLEALKLRSKAQILIREVGGKRRALSGEACRLFDNR